MNQLFIQQAESLIDPSLPKISNLSNLLALAFYEYPDINWIGFYYCDNAKKECTLGPFQGKVACTRIPFHKGVVGTAAVQQKALTVNDVHCFPGHIACDSQTNAELVFPLIKEKETYAILDIDSLVLNYFDEDKVETFQAYTRLIQSILFNDKQSILFNDKL